MSADLATATVGQVVARPHAKRLVAWAADKPEVLVLSADLTASCEADGFRQAYPQRFVSLGVAEQNLIGFAAGLAREGFIPYLHTFGVFLTRRPFDQVAMSVGYPCLPVRLLGFLPGITTPGGVTHQATDDVALMRAIPNMTVLECGDATEVEQILDVCHPIPGPVYVRMLRGEVIRLFDPSEPMVLGRARVLRQGRQITVLTSGICTEEALRALPLLEQHDISITHLHISTLKPFADPQVAAAIAHAQIGVITLENHGIIGGLGSAVAEVMAEMGAGKPLIRLGLRDTYAHGASKAYLMEKYGLDAFALVKAVAQLTGRDLPIAREDLAAVRLEAVHSATKAEAL